MLLQSVPNQPETIQNAGNNQPQRIPRGLYHDIMPEPIGAAMHHISPNRSRQTGAACHGQPVPDFSRLSGQGSVQPVHISPICHAKKVLSANFSAELHQIIVMRNY